MASRLSFDSRRSCEYEISLAAGWDFKGLSDDGCLDRAAVCFLLRLLTVPRPRKTGRVFRKPRPSIFENLFFEFEFSSIFFDGEIGMMFVFLPEFEPQEFAEAVC